MVCSRAPGGSCSRFTRPPVRIQEAWGAGRLRGLIIQQRPGLCGITHPRITIPAESAGSQCQPPQPQTQRRTCGLLDLAHRVAAATDDESGVDCV